MIRKGIQKIAQFLPTNFLLGKCELDTFLPFYHGVHNGEQDVMIKHLYPMPSIGKLKNDIEELLDLFKPVELDDLFKKESRKLRQRSFHLTFDDGLSSCYHLIMPLLLEKNIRATFFLNTDFIDNKDLFYRYKVSLIIEKIFQDSISRTMVMEKLKVDNYDQAKIRLLEFDHHDIPEIDKLAESIDLNFKTFLKEKKPYLTTAQINEMIQHGFTFGSHSCNHPHYSSIGLEEQIRQTIESSRVVKEKFNLNYAVFAFPFTDSGVGRDFFEKLEESKTIDLTFGTAGIKKDPFEFNLHRTAMEGYSGSAKQRIKGEYGYYFLKSILGRNTKRF